MPIDLEFAHARERLLRRYDRDLRKASRDLKVKKLVNKKTLYRLFDSAVSNDRFQSDVRDKVIKFISPTSSSRLYFAVADILNAGEDEISKIKKYEGRYRYFRKRTSGPVVSGTIDIVSRNDFYVFFHSNSERNDEFPMQEWDHEGFVFQLGPRLHLLGIGSRYLRPIVAQECTDPAKELIHGFVVANTDQSLGANLFAARFVMIHERHPHYRAKLSDKKIKGYLEDGCENAGILRLS